MILEHTAAQHSPASQDLRRALDPRASTGVVMVGLCAFSGSLGGSRLVPAKMKSFDEKYPYIAAWVRDGTIEIGYNDYDDVFLRVIDAGGVIWESNKSYSNLDDAFNEMNTAIETWCTENGIELEF